MSEKVSSIYQGEIKRLSRRIALGKRRLARGIDQRKEKRGVVSEKEIVAKLEGKVSQLRNGVWPK